MDEKQTRLLVWMTGALLALVALLVLVQPPADDDEDGKWSRAWPGVEAEAIRRIAITGRAEDGTAETLAVAERVDEGESGSDDAGKWRLVEPVRARADDEAVDRLARALAELEVGEVLEGGDPAAYGLDAPQGTVRFTLDGGEEHAVVVGDDTPVGWSSYVALDDAKEPRTSRSRLKSKLLKAADDLRSRVVADFSPTAVSRVEIAPGDGASDEATGEIAGPVVLRHDDHGWWVESGGVARRADGDKVHGLLRAFADLRVDRWLDGPVDLPPPALRVTITPEPTGGPEAAEGAEGAGGEPVELFLGPVEDGGRTVRGPAQPGPVRVLSSNLDDRLAGLPDALVSDRLLPVRGPTLERVDVALGEVSFAATREDGSWSDAAAETVIDALADARADRTVAVSVAAKPWGHVELAEANRTERVDLYQEAEGGRVARDAAGGPPFLVPDTEIDRLLDALGGGEAD